MEGVGARLGRSSSRYGTTTVFNGPVRKWKKDWVPITPSSSSSNSNNHHHHHNNNHHHHNNNNNHHSSSNGSVNGSNGNTVSHLRLYKWTPLNKENSNSGDNNSNSNSKISNSNLVANGSKDSALDDAVSVEPPRRKFKYIPIAVLEEQKKDAEENTDDDEEAKPVESDDNAGEQPSKSDNNDEKPDINDVPMEENQAVEENQTAPARQDLNELDLSLGLTSHDEEHDSDSKTDQKTDVQLERENSGA